MVVGQRVAAPMLWPQLKRRRAPPVGQTTGRTLLPSAPWMNVRRGLRMTFQEVMQDVEKREHVHAITAALRIADVVHNDVPNLFGPPRLAEQILSVRRS